MRLLPAIWSAWMAGFLSYFRPDRRGSVGGDADAGVIGFERRANLTEKSAIPKERHAWIHVMNQVVVLAEQHDVAKNPATNLSIAIARCFIERHMRQPYEPHLQDQLCELGGQPPQQQEVQALSKEKRNNQQQQTCLQMAIQNWAIRLEVLNADTDFRRQNFEQHISQERDASEGLNDGGDQPAGKYCFARSGHEVVGVFAGDVGVGMMQ